VLHGNIRQSRQVIDLCIFSFDYTKNGELLCKITGIDTTSYTYDNFGNLTEVELPNGDAIEYLIDGKNRRIGKSINGVVTKRWIYSGDFTPVAELDSNGNVMARYIGSYMIKGDSTYRIIRDNLGSVRLVVNIQTGTISQRLDYDEFGRIMSDTNPDFCPFGFGGGLYESGTGLVRFGARDYAADVGRWLKKDPIGFSGGSANTYSYADNDPINMVDPSGLSCKKCVGVARFSAVGPSQATGTGALSGFGVRPKSGSVAVSPADFGLPFPEGSSLTAAQISQRIQSQRMLAEAARQIRILPIGLNLRGGPASPYTVGDIGDKNIRNSKTPRFDLYGLPTQKQALQFGVKTFKLP
jgi:RHS repeat-associated protein